MTTLTATISNQRPMSYEDRATRTRVFVSFTQGFDLLEDLTNRTSRPYNVVRPAVEKALKDAGFEYRRLAWSQKAGCSMCPCSPGFIMKDQVAGPRRMNVWLTLSENVQETINVDRLAAIAGDATLPASITGPATSSLQALLP